MRVLSIFKRHVQMDGDLKVRRTRSCGAGASMATRKEYLGRCKKGAIVLLEAGDLKSAIASMFSDVRKSDEPLYDAAILRVLLADALFFRNTPDQVRDWIDGFN